MLSALTSLRHLKLIGKISRREKDATRVVDKTQQLRDGTPLYCQADFGHFVRRLKKRCHGLIEVEWCYSEMFYCRGEGVIPFRYSAIE